MIAILVSTYNRPRALERSLPQIAALGAPALVVDDGSEEWEANAAICRYNNALYLRIPQNRGLAAAMNIGLDYFFADKAVRWISYFQDDVDVHPKILKAISGMHQFGCVFSGHDAGEHKPYMTQDLAGVRVAYKWSIRATHIHASADFWHSVYPIQTRELGTPKRNGAGRGIGSNADWWIVRDAPRSCMKTKRPVICVPGLVRSFLWEAKDSSWNNTQAAGEEPPLRTDL